MVLLLLTLLRCLRSFWGNRLHNKKGSRPENMYCKVYDVICHPQAIVHMLLCTFAFATLTSYRFAPLLLMDVATFNKTLGNVVLAATKPYKELLMTLALALIIVFIYTSFGCVPVLDQSVLLVSNARARADHTFLTLSAPPRYCTCTLSCTLPQDVFFRRNIPRRS